MPSSLEGLIRIAIVGASSLRGKELKQVLEDRNFPATDIVLLDESILAGTLTEAAGEPTFIRALEEDSFEGARFVFFAGSTADAQRNWTVARRAGAVVIDLTDALAESGEGTLWIPGLGAEFPPVAGARAGESGAAVAYSSPPPPVLIACTIAAGLRELKPQRIAILFFPPVSERDQAGVDELESQTASLLSFREIAKPVFGTQVAFNLASEYGKETKPGVGDMRALAAREIARYLAGRAPVPAIQLVQAPVFYGYAFAAFVELGSQADVARVEDALQQAGIKVCGGGEAAPTNVSVAGENEVQIARAEADVNTPEAVWLWGVADNLRLAAVNAVRIAEELVAKSAVH
jgi:aspartate-semialdehyde dehydrogenase